MLAHDAPGDVDWLASKVRVRQAFVRDEYQKPKSRRGERAVPMPQRVAAELEALSRESAYTGDDDLVFCHPHTGKPIDRSKLFKRWRAAARRAGVYTDTRQVRAAQVAGALGPRDYKTTLIHADYAPSTREAEWAEAAFSVPKMTAAA